MKFDLITTFAWKTPRLLGSLFSRKCSQAFLQGLISSDWIIWAPLLKLLSSFSVMFLSWELVVALCGLQGHTQQPSWKGRAGYEELPGCGFGGSCYALGAFSLLCWSAVEAADKHLCSSWGRGRKHSGALTLAADWQQAVYPDPQALSSIWCWGGASDEREYALWKFRSVLLCSEAGCKAPKISVEFLNTERTLAWPVFPGILANLAYSFPWVWGALCFLIGLFGKEQKFELPGMFCVVFGG